MQMQSGRTARDVYFFFSFFVVRYFKSYPSRSSCRCRCRCRCRRRPLHRRRRFLSALRCGAVRYGAVRCGAVRYGAVRYGAVRYGTVVLFVLYGAVSCGRAGLYGETAGQSVGTVPPAAVIYRSRFFFRASQLVTVSAMKAISSVYPSTTTNR